MHLPVARKISRSTWSAPLTLQINILELTGRTVRAGLSHCHGDTQPIPSELGLDKVCSLTDIVCHGN